MAATLKVTHKTVSGTGGGGGGKRVSTTGRVVESEKGSAAEVEPSGQTRVVLTSTLQQPG